MKKVLCIVSISAVFASLVLEAPVFANEHTTVAESTELSEQEKQALLAEISRQLEEVERELLRLSLIVQKMALEQQALALQKRLEQTATGEVEEGTGVAVPVPRIEEEIKEGVVEEEPAVEESVAQAVVSADEPDEALLQEEDLDESKEDEERGFLAALGALGNVGTPELAALAILVFLVAFMLVRRLRERGVRPAQIIPAQGEQQPQIFQSSSEGASPQVSPSRGEQTRLDESRQGLKERVAWE